MKKKYISLKFFLFFKIIFIFGKNADMYFFYPK